jgi:hypothetical protein
MEYALYLESGPQHKTTMVHVLTLLGCITRKGTTEAALDATPAAICKYLKFLQSHGEAVDPDGPFSTRVAQHISEGSWLGNGDPTPGFPPDFETLTSADLAKYIHWLTWMHSDLLDMLMDIPQPRWEEKPEGSGRPIYEILRHSAESQCVYLRYLVGKVEGLNELLHQLGPDPLLSGRAYERMNETTTARLKQLTDQERSMRVAHGQVTWTARRAMRRMLEHLWEHTLEIEARTLP